MTDNMSNPRQGSQIHCIVLEGNYLMQLHSVCYQRWSSHLAFAQLLRAQTVETREKSEVKLVQAMLSESRVESLNVLVPLCKKLQAITHHTEVLQAKKSNRARFSTPVPPREKKNMLCLFK